MDARQQLIDEIDALRALRDELRVQAHLGQMEARDLWERMEKDWEQLETRMSAVGRASSESLHEIGDAARELARGIKDGYRRLRESL